MRIELLVLLAELDFTVIDGELAPLKGQPALHRADPAVELPVIQIAVELELASHLGIEHRVFQPQIARNIDIHGITQRFKRQIEIERGLAEQIVGNLHLAFRNLDPTDHHRIVQVTGNVNAGRCSLYVDASPGHVEFLSRKLHRQRPRTFAEIHFAETGKDAPAELRLNRFDPHQPFFRVHADFHLRQRSFHSLETDRIAVHACHAGDLRVERVSGKMQRGLAPPFRRVEKLGQIDRQIVKRT